MSNDRYNEMMVQRIDDQRLDPPEVSYDPNLLHCSWCGRLINDGEKYYELGMDEVCKDCIEECAWYA